MIALLDLIMFLALTIVSGFAIALYLMRNRDKRYFDKRIKEYEDAFSRKDPFVNELERTNGSLQEQVRTLKKELGALQSWRDFLKKVGYTESEVTSGAKPTPEQLESRMVKLAWEMALSQSNNEELASYRRQALGLMSRCLADEVQELWTRLDKGESVEDLRGMFRDLLVKIGALETVS